MICKKCGVELNGKYAFCPKCGNQLKKKSKPGIIIIGIILLLGIVITLYVTGSYKNIVTRFGKMSDETVAVITSTAAEDVDQTVLEKQQEENIKSEIDEAVEENVKETDELESFLENLTLEPIEMTMGETYQLELAQEISDVLWISSDSGIVEVAEGQLKAVMPGTATVTFSVEGKEYPFEVTVNAFSDITLAVNCSKMMEINDAVSNVRWESSDPEIVSVEDGCINSLSAGASTITVYIDEIPYPFEVIATTPDITTTSVRKIIGNTEQVYILGTNGKVEWKSDNTAIATVSDTGLITAEPSGAGQSTVVHAYVDGMEFKIDVTVEPIPQLSSTYKIYGYEDNSTYKNAQITICTNANETLTYTLKDPDSSFWSYEPECHKVINVADADYSDNLTFPLYRAYRKYTLWDSNMNRNVSTDTYSHTDVYLVGTSQNADVLIQKMPSFSSQNLYSEVDDSVVVYEACENYGIIHMYFGDYMSNAYFLITVSVDGYVYQFAVGKAEGSSANGGNFNYAKIDELPADYVIEECSIDEIVVQEKNSVDYSAVKSNSKTYNPSNDWLERIGTKFVEAVEDQAIEMAAGALLKVIFL